jgi:SAM-dependent methyltransferase
MRETSKAYLSRLHRGDFERFLKGTGIDIGAGEDPLRLPPNLGGKVRPWDKTDGDANTLIGVPDNTFDFIYSSHCLEHLPDVPLALESWVRVLKQKGHLYVSVPDYVLYEHMAWPSKHNGDHRHSFSMDLTREKVGRTNHWHITNDIKPVLSTIGCTLVDVFLEDEGFDYSGHERGDQTLNNALAQITFIVNKPSVP